MTVKINADTTNGLVMTPDTSGEIELQSDSVTKVTVKSDGDVGIGTSSPDTKLDVISTGVEGLQLKDTSTTASPRFFLTNDANTWVIYNNSDDLSIRANATIGVTSGTEVFRIEQATGYVTQNNNAMGATQITIADDAVGSVATPRNGGMAIITANGNSAFPSPQFSAIIYWDTGDSLRCDYIPSASWSSNNSSAFSTTTGALTGTSATDGNVLVSANTNQLEINNRANATYTFQITFL